MTVPSLRRHQFLLAGLRWIVFFFWCALGLQVFFVARIAMMRYVDPGSTAFQRSELGRLSHKFPAVRWSQQWVAQPKLPVHIQRAVIASEDDIFDAKARLQNARISSSNEANSVTSEIISLLKSADSRLDKVMETSDSKRDDQKTSEAKKDSQKAADSKPVKCGHCGKVCDPGTSSCKSCGAPLS
jgi:monofunctional biosynthetic peptidoglycan transglycosylase